MNLEPFGIRLDDKIPFSHNFTWREMLWCPQWGIYIFPSDDQIKAVCNFMPKAQKVREILGVPMRITSGLRPFKYNDLIGGAPNSMHTKGRAIDFMSPRMEVPEIKRILLPKLEELGLRMEDDGRNRVHIDDKEPGFSGRFFRP